MDAAAGNRIEPWRVFFPSALLIAPLNVVAWLAIRAGLPAPAGVDSAAWHGGEMVFGYGFAVIAGYLLRPMPAIALLALWVLWLAGRVVALLAPDALPAVASLALAAAFPVGLAALGLGRFAAVKRARNLPFPLVMLTLGIAAFGSFGVRVGLLPPPQRSPVALAAGVVALLVMMMGGRLVPTATVGALRARGLVLRIPTRPVLEATLFVLVLGWVASDAFLGPLPAGALALAAGATLATAASGWYPLRTAHDPLTWPLHAGIAWLALGCALGGLERLGVVAMPDAGALHALTAGGIGSVSLVMMMRVTRYRAGVLPATDARLNAVHLAMALAVALRVFGGWLLPAIGGWMLWLSAAAWTAAYLGAAFLVVPAALRAQRHG